MASDGAPWLVRMRCFAVAGFVAAGICAPRMAMAANNCPWLNEATASGLLGGDATGEFTDAAAEQPAACTFTQKNAAGVRVLTIVVQIVNDAHSRVERLAHDCGMAAAPMAAIGNEALVCPVDDRRGATSQRVIGRVRNQVFMISLSTTLRGDPVLSRDELRARIGTAAEQISANLF